ncbi:MAG: OmpH family outer membrane protein [Bacteroidales bacterium]|nr:OmpH family outer membrane protein [Bacteroidales bacterium]
MEINLEKNEERMADVINIENVAEVQPVVASDELKTEPVGTTPPAENSCKSAPKRQRCCWITVGFVVLFAAVITLFILFFTQKGADSKSNPALASLMEKGETPYMLTVNNDSIVANFVLVKILTDDLEEESSRYQKELQTKQSVLEEKYKNYQINVQNQVLTKTQMQNAEAQLTQEAATLKTLQEKYATILANKQTSVQKEIADSIISVTSRINDRKYHAKYVFATSSGSAVVYSSPEFDITEEVIAELNRSYEKTNGKHE